MAIGWRLAMHTALYGRDGFFVRAGNGPADHFRTSVHASPLFAGALAHLVRRIDEALGHPPRLDIVDVGAGRGELLTALRSRLPGRLSERAHLVGVEMGARPHHLDPAIGWQRHVPDHVVGLLVATEWLDNVPLDIVQMDESGRVHRVLVDPATGAESIGEMVDAADNLWLSRWWPLAHPGAVRAEIGWPRDLAWADAVAAVRRGAALAVDYGHVRADRPAYGTLTGFRTGRQVEPVPDAGCDITAHVAMDSAGSAAGGAYALVSQRFALRALGIDGRRPPLDLAHADPAAYLRALSAAGAAAELTDPAGLGGHRWLLHSVGLGAPTALLSGAEPVTPRQI